MKNFIILTLCLLEDLEAIIFFVAGFYFAVILMFANGFKWWYILIAVVVATAFNYLTEWLLAKVIKEV